MVEDEDCSTYARNKRFLKLDKAKPTDGVADTTNAPCKPPQDEEDGTEVPQTPQQRKKEVSFSKDTKKTDGGTKARRSERIRKARDTGDRLVHSLRLHGPATWGPFTYRPGNGTKGGHWVEYVDLDGAA